MKRTIEISEETYELIKDQLQTEETIPINSYEDMVGNKFFFRTVTYHLLGRVTKIVGEFAVLEQASWVADSGKFSTALATGELSEVEMLGKSRIAYVNLSAVTDFFPWDHDLPKVTK